MQRLQDEAFILLKNTIYRGESPKHRFETYVNRHIKAHKLLVEAGYNDSKGMDNSTKIQHLKSGIKLEAGFRFTNTDYLDDVSTNYYNREKLSRTNHLFHRSKNEQDLANKVLQKIKKRYEFLSHPRRNFYQTFAHFFF